MSTQAETTHSHEQATAPAEETTLVGFLAEFESVAAVVSAAKKVRAAGYKIWDVHSPFPIHGIDAVIGIRPTILPWLVLCGGLVGLCTGFALQWWTNAYDYKF